MACLLLKWQFPFYSMPSINLTQRLANATCAIYQSGKHILSTEVWLARLMCHGACTRNAHITLNGITSLVPRLECVGRAWERGYGITRLVNLVNLVLHIKRRREKKYRYPLLQRRAISGRVNLCYARCLYIWFSIRIEPFVAVTCNVQQCATLHTDLHQTVPPISCHNLRS